MRKSLPVRRYQVRLWIRAVLGRILRVIPLTTVDRIRRARRAAPAGSVQHRSWQRLLNVLRHRSIGSDVGAIRIDELGIMLTNDEAVLTKRLYFLGEYEAGEWYWWQKWCEHSAHVVEFGANTGVYTIVGGRVASVQSYVAVEPHPHTAEILRRNLQLNGVTRVQVVQAAVVGERTVSRLTLAVPDRDRDATPTGAHLVSASDHELAREVIEVEVVEARTFVERADLIKMDIEGQELAVLRAVEPVLIERCPTLFIELRRSSDALRSYLPELCARAQYSVFAIHGRVLQPISVADIGHLDFQQRFGTRDVVLTTHALA